MAPTSTWSSAATPVDLARLLRLDKQVVRACYEFAEAASPALCDRRRFR